MISANEGGGVHTRAHGGWLSGVLPKRTEGADITAGKTIDQYAADKLGADTPLRSLELTTESNFMVGNCENGYSCAYLNSTSWRTPTTPLPHERNPRVVFERLFGDGGSVTARLAEMRKDRSILDSVTESMQRLEQRLGLGDRRTVNEYLESVREVERRIQRAEQNNDSTPLPSLEQPAGVPDGYDEHAKLLIDLLVLGLSGRRHARLVHADRARVERPDVPAHRRAGRASPGVASPERPAQHPAEHEDQHLPHVALRAVVEKMRNTPDGDGTLLDHSMLRLRRRHGRRRSAHAGQYAGGARRRRLRPAEGRTSSEVRASTRRS